MQAMLPQSLSLVYFLNIILGSERDTAELQSVVSQPHGQHLFSIPNIHGLRVVVGEIAREMKAGHFPCATLERP